MTTRRLLLSLLLILPVTGFAAPADDTLGVIEMSLDSVDAAAPPADSVPVIEKMPEVTRFIKADYPSDMVKRGIEGSVLMDLLVSDSGHVDNVAVVKGLNPSMDSAAVAAVRKFLFSPAIAGGKPVVVVLQYEYRFTLDEVKVGSDTVINFEGRLLERGTKTPLVDAMVVLNFIDTTADTSLPVPFGVYRDRIGKIPGQYLEENRLVTLTDSTGRFRFRNLPACSLEITSPLSGYEAFKQQEKIVRGIALDVTYYIRRISYNDYEITVYGKVEEKEVSRREITLAEIKKIPGLGGDAVRVVQAMPGVARPSFGGNAIVVRGAPTWDSKFCLDGINIPLIFHYTSTKSTYNSDALSGVNFYPGGWGTRYGGGIAGVIDLNSRSAKKDRWQGYIDPNLADGTIMLEGPIGKNKKVSVLASARMSFYGYILDWVFKNIELNLPFSVSPSYWDYILRTDVDLSKTSHVFLTLFGSGDKLKMVVPSMTIGSSEVDKAVDQMRMEVAFHMAMLGWDAQLSKAWSNSLRYGFTYAQSEMSIFGIVKSTEKPALINQLRDQATHTWNERLKLNVGVDASLYDENLILVIPDQTNVPQRDTSENWLFGVVGGYLNLEWRPIKKLLITPGLRYDFYPELDYHGAWLPEFWDKGYENINNTTRFSGEPSFRLNGRYELVKNHTIKAAIGNYSQTPQPMGQVIHKRWGYPKLPATKGAQYVLGYEWRVMDLLSLDVQGYYNRQWNIPRMATSSDLKRSTDQLWYPDAKGRMEGLEVMIKHDQGKHFFGWLAYTLSRSERYDPNNDRWDIYSEDETHNLQLLGSWRLKRDWDVGFRARYVTGKPTTPIDSVKVQADPPVTYYVVYGRTNSERVDPFFQLDVRVDKKFVLDKFMVSVYLDIQDLSWFFYKSPEMYIYNYDYSERQPVSQFITPAFGVKVEF